jgi:hypothetical protein
MKLYMEVEGSRINNVPLWLDFKISTDLELQIMENKQFWK